MTFPCSCPLRVTPPAVKLLVTAPDWGDLLKTRLPASPEHPRALLTLLEGLSLWHGHPISVALPAEVCWSGEHSSALFGDGWWPSECPLVEFRAEHRARRGRLVGLGDFGALRRRTR